MNTVYILKCADGTLYTGSTVNIEKRLSEHNGEIKGGAKYTSGRRPVVVVYREECDSFAISRSREAEIKSMDRAEKLALIKTKGKSMVK